MDRRSRAHVAILKALRGSEGALSSARITALLNDAKFDLSDRSVRLYLQQLAEEGLVEVGARGATLTAAGAEELNAAQVLQRVGSLAARIARMTYLMGFDLPTCTGEVVVNMSLVSRDALAACRDEFCAVFAKGLAMGNRMALLAPGERLGDLVVAPGQVGVCTVCSITLNGVLLKHGIPIHSRFGGVLEVRDLKPQRFLDFIAYEGTSVDPLEVFILSGMTDYRSAVATGHGRVGASFREIPPESRERVQSLAERLARIGLGGFMAVGGDGEDLCGIPVTDGRAGAVVVGGLNPLSIIHEHGHPCRLAALSGFLEFTRLFHYEELSQRLKTLSG